MTPTHQLPFATRYRCGSRPPFRCTYALATATFPFTPDHITGSLRRKRHCRRLGRVQAGWDGCVTEVTGDVAAPFSVATAALATATATPPEGRRCGDVGASLPTRHYRQCMAELWSPSHHPTSLLCRQRPLVPPRAFQSALVTRTRCVPATSGTA